MLGRKVAPKVAPSAGRRDETVFIQHVVTSGVCMCAVRLHTHTCTHVPGGICCLDEIYAIILFFQRHPCSSAHLVLEDPVPLVCKVWGQLSAAGARSAPRTAWQLIVVRKEARPRRSASELSSACLRP